MASPRRNSDAVASHSYRAIPQSTHRQIDVRAAVERVNGKWRDPEDVRRMAHRNYELAFIEMRAAWAPVELEHAILGGYDQPLPYDGGRRGKCTDDDEDFHDPADRAVDTRVPIVDFETTPAPAMQQYCDEFRACMVWATRNTKSGSAPDLMQMGARMLTIFHVLAPQLKIGMDLPIPRSMRVQLMNSVHESAEVGRFFRRPLAWVRKCTSLVQLGKRGYAMIYVLAGDLINSLTCAAIGGLDNKTRQAANKPIQDFRDSFGGIKSLPMRGKLTRKRCKESQEKR